MTATADAMRATTNELNEATTAQTPRLRTVLKRNIFWLVLLGFVIVVALFSVAMSGTLSGTDRLGHDNPKPSGAQAVFEVLSQQGVKTHAASSFEEALAQLQQFGPEKTTLVLFDSNQVLSEKQIKTLNETSAHRVFIEPGHRILQALLPDVGQAGYATSGSKAASCQWPGATRAGTISEGGRAYRDLKHQSVPCFPGSDGDSYSLLMFGDGDSDTTVLGASQVLANGTILEEGNAALALNLLGQHEHLVWYLPNFKDAENATVTLADLVPKWLTPFMMLSFVVVIAAGFWRGRRQGRLVMENLPVTVPASETFEGRARLYQKAQALNRSLDYLRMGSLKRIGSALGLPKTASVHEVLLNISALTAWDQPSLTELYLNKRAANEAELVALSDQLALNEAEILKRLKL
ncbi:MAG: DUF4350 domain-containing protein [Microbacteriaceae bacterium]